MLSIFNKIRKTDLDSEEESGLTPIRVLVGFLEDVSESDALKYVQDLATRHFETSTLSFFKVFKFRNGFIYEAHEGGSGFSYVYEILDQIAKVPPTEAYSDFYIKTATRPVKVSISASKVQAVFLTSSKVNEVNSYVTALTVKMTPAFDTRAGLKSAGLAIFGTGVVAFLLSMAVGRYQPVTHAELAPTKVTIENLPIAKWESIVSESKLKASSQKLSKVEFVKNRWEPLIFKPIDKVQEIENKDSDKKGTDKVESSFKKGVPSEPNKIVNNKDIRNPSAIDQSSGPSKLSDLIANSKKESK